ncbi:N-acetylglucosamine-6-phosphate deacetylase [Roseburia intestinalis XB6B4]|nr:amidohydrolase family protein [Roseburia intestinalis]CBL12491.1 N-acetylglucosamine-6-phosphate deacetylase [Roseburia intestinalis XB6B4]
MPADKEMFLRLQERSGGLIKLVDIAPEEKGAMEFIEQCHDKVKISIAHTCSDYDTAREALEKGVGHMTHLYNAMPGINHREPGPIIAALEAGAEVELIADGIHIHPAMVRTTFRIFGADKVILISDSMEATGLLDGDYQLGGQGVTVKGRKAVLTKDPGVIAGSVTNLFDCMKNCVLNMGIPLEDAVLAATENPAESIGVEKDYGKIAVGNYGNLLLLDKDLQIKNIVQKGKIMSV